MMPIALENGMELSEFEQRSFKEIEMIITIKRKRYEDDLKSKIMLEYQMVDLMAASIARVMSGKAEFPEIYEIYPTLFDDELTQSIEREREELEAQRLTAEWKKYAEGHNAALKKI